MSDTSRCDLIHYYSGASVGVRLIGPLQQICAFACIYTVILCSLCGISESLLSDYTYNEVCFSQGWSLVHSTVFPSFRFKTSLLIRSFYRFTHSCVIEMTMHILWLANFYKFSCELAEWIHRTFRVSGITTSSSSSSCCCFFELFSATFWRHSRMNGTAKRNCPVYFCTKSSSNRSDFRESALRPLNPSKLNNLS